MLRRISALLSFGLASALNLPPLSPRLLFPSGIQNGDTALKSQNAYYHEQINLTPPMYFFNETVNFLTMTTNGVVFVNGDCPECHIPEPCAERPAKAGTKMVACYWADGNPSRGAGGLVSYRRSREQSEVLAASQYLRKADNRINLALDQTELFIATWANVTASGSKDLDKVNTFQCTLVTDGSESYVAFSYARLDWRSSYWSPGINPVMGLDNGQTGCSNTSLPYSDTAKAEQLLSASNFASLPLPAATPAGQFALGAGSCPQQPRQYHLPPGTRIATCTAHADPHYKSFDGQNIRSLFLPGTYSVTQKQKANAWALMAATSTCNDDIVRKGYPPFAVQILPVGPVGGITNPGGLKVRFFLSTLHLYEGADAHWNDDLTIELYRDHFVLNQVQHTKDGWQRRVVSKADRWECREICGFGSRQGVQYMINVVKQSRGYAIETDFGFGASASPNSAVSVSIPDIPELKGNTFGFCGNFDGIPQNDGWCVDASLQSGDKYKECWQSSVLSDFSVAATPGYFMCLHYPPNVVYTATSAPRTIRGVAGFLSAMRAAAKLRVGGGACSILLDPAGPFRPCQGLSEWRSFYDNCVADVGEVNGALEIVCLDLKVAADACAAEIPHVRVAYRGPGSDCEVKCGPNSHWDDLASGCPATCDSPLAPQLCNQPSAGACVCDTGRVLMGQDCVLPSACTACLGSGSATYARGESWLSSDCGQNCTCAAGKKADCAAATCGPNAACAANTNGPYCACNNGFFGDGYSCTAVDHCAGVTCLHGGFCLNQAARGRAECVCQDGWTGSRCESAVDACASTPCGNGAECRSSFGGTFDCTCARGWDGPSCFQRLDPCSSFPCLNLATCSGDKATQTFSCHCAAGYSGHDCAIADPPTTAAPPLTTPPLLTTPRPALPTTSNSCGICQDFGSVPIGPCNRSYWFCFQRCFQPFKATCPFGEVFYKGCIDPRLDPDCPK